MADDDDVIYVDVRAKLDEAAAEKETGKLRDKLKDGVKGAGKAISDVLHSELAEQLGDAIAPAARNAGEQLARELGSRAGDFLHDQVSDALKSVGVDFDGLIDKSRELGDKFGIDADSVTKIADAFKAIKSGDSAGLLKQLGDNAEKLPGPLGEIASKSHDVQSKLDSLKGDVKETTDGFMTFVGDSPRISGAFETLGKAIGPVAILMGTLASVDKDFGSNLERLLGDLEHHNIPDALKAGAGMMWDSLKLPFEWFGPDTQTHRTETHTPLPPGTTPIPGLSPATGGVSGGAPSVGGVPIPGMTPLPGVPGTPGTPAHTSGFASSGIPHVTLADFNTTPSDTEGLAAAGGGVANLYRFAQSLVGTPYSQQLRNDCSGMVSELANVAVGLPPPGPGQRFSTVNEGQSLAAMGFQPGLGGPNDLNIGWYDHGGGNYGHTAATLPGGINAEQGGSHGSFTLGAGAAGASNPEFTQHAHLSMGGGAPFRAAGYGIPGTPFMPGLGAYAPPPTQANQGGGGPVQQQQLGHGSGVGVGGGVIGMAEQAGAMAAGAMTFGGGAIAAQIAEQEINLAVQKGGQMAAVAAMAPFETFGLHGGQMGAPSVSPGGGWIGKVLGGLIGQQFNSPNIAGATQQPKQPQEQQNSQSGQQGGGQQGGSAGPTGEKDDPIHVKSVSPAQGPQQGMATSAMSGIGYMSPLAV